MEASQQEPKNPLGLSLDFMFGRGYLWAKRQRLSDWIALESLRMEIPDLQFPFDARGGLQRFRHTRCLVREVEFAISEVGLGDLLTEAASHLEGFEELQVRFLEDAAHISLKVNTFGADTYLSFRAALIPPEPARADEVHLSLYDYRAYGPLPYPARLVVHELLTSLLNTPVLRASGRGRSFTVGIAGDIVSFRPLKLLFLYIFPRVGWKLPNLSGVVLESARIRPGVLTIRAVDDDPQSGARRRGVDHELATSREGAQALAAYEAKELFSHADKALFEGQIRQALSLLSNYRDIYGLHPALVARLLDCLVADPSPANLAEAESMRRELVAEDPSDLLAALVGPLLALARRRDDDARQAFEELSEQLKSRRQTRDWILCELALAKLLADDSPREAAKRLREVLKRDPRHRAALEALRQIYEKLDERAGLEETLKRLTGVYTERDTLKKTYLELARHLMDREGDLAEARMYLEKVLRLDATELEALHTLGESYVLGGEPLRALKAFGSAARAAEAEGLSVQGSKLYFRVGELWYQELEDPRQALLSFRRALSLSEEADESGEDSVGPMERVRQLRRAAEMCEELSRDEEATQYWSEALPVLERQVERRGPVFEDSEESNYDDELIEVHRRLGAIYERRERPSAAASHFRRILEIDATDEEARQWMENHLRQAGRPEELIELYSDLIEEADGDVDRVELIEKLADLYGAMGLPEDAQSNYRRILEFDPSRRDVRKKLVDLLSGHKRFETLRDALNTVLVRTRDRQGRYEISMELGAANEAMQARGRAIRSYLEAVKLSTGDRDALESVCRVLEAFVEEFGVSTAAPAGSQPAGQLLEKLFIRLAEVAPSTTQQREVLVKVAMLAEERGDTAAAAEARERAEELRVVNEDTDTFSDVDNRLDAMLDELAGPSATTKETPLNKIELPKPSKKPGKKERGSDGKDGEKVSSFRRRFQEMVKKPANLPRPEDVKSGATLTKILERGDDKDSTDDSDDSSESFTEETFAEEPGTVQFSVADLEGLRQRTEADEEEGFSDDLSEKSEAEQEWIGQFSDDDSGRGLDEESEIDTSPEINPVKMALSALDEVRNSNDPRNVAEAIENVLSLAEGSESDYLNADKKLAMYKEAGELFYYDLEDGEAALSHLEAVRKLDPDGDGASAAVVNALEAIYEERGEIGARIDLLEQRLAAAGTQEMKTTYRLLLAQLVWDQRDDYDTARRWLAEVLETDAEHEAAHRLLAEMARTEEDWKSAARHLEVVVRVAGGGIDAVESERELAEIFLHNLDDPERARNHFESVLNEAPGDSQALEGIKESQASRGDWQGYVESLGRELGLLTGKMEGLTPQEMAELDAPSIAAALRVPASQIVADAAHVVEEEIKDTEMARQLWGVTYRLWPEHVEALERRIALSREVDEVADLAEDLESYAAMILDPGGRFEALVEAAELRADSLDDQERARPLYTEAIALVQNSDDPPAGVDAARRALKRLQNDGEWQ